MTATTSANCARPSTESLPTSTDWLPVDWEDGRQLGRRAATRRRIVTTYGSHHFEVMIERPDGSLLTASAVQVGDAGMPVTKAQLIGLAQSDRWVHLGN